MKPSVEQVVTTWQKWKWKKKIMRKCCKFNCKFITRNWHAACPKMVNSAIEPVWQTLKFILPFKFFSVFFIFNLADRFSHEKKSKYFVFIWNYSKQTQKNIRLVFYFLLLVPIGRSFGHFYFVWFLFIYLLLLFFVHIYALWHNERQKMFQ